MKDSEGEKKQKLIAKLKILEVIQKLIMEHNYESDTLFHLLQFWEEINKIQI